MVRKRFHLLVALSFLLGAGLVTALVGTRDPLVDEFIAAVYSDRNATSEQDIAGIERIDSMIGRMSVSQLAQVAAAIPTDSVPEIYDHSLANIAMVGITMRLGDSLYANIVRYVDGRITHEEGTAINSAIAGAFANNPRFFPWLANHIGSLTEKDIKSVNGLEEVMRMYVIASIVKAAQLRCLCYYEELSLKSPGNPARCKDIKVEPLQLDSMPQDSIHRRAKPTRRAPPPITT